jgi:peptidoglycan/LPS O-acetylase OafA/YrhL
LFDAAMDGTETVKRISPHTSNLLDLTRAIAAGLVVLFHARIYVLGGTLPSGTLLSIVYRVTNCGTQAVFWFFVISGYLVGGAILEDIETGRFSFGKYWINRATRLYVVLLPALLVGWLLDETRVASLGLNAHAGLETAASLAPSTFIGNLAFLQTIFVPTFGSNYVLWSLANEFWYYLLFPLFLAPLYTSVSRFWRFAIFAIGIVIYLVLMRQNGSLAWLFVIWCIGVGARWLPMPLIKSETIAWLVAIAAMFVFPLVHPVLGPAATLLVAVTFACAINASHGKMWKWKYGNAVKAFAAFSYSLYLVHLPMQHYLLTMTRGNADPFLSLQPADPKAFLVIGGLFVASYAFAYAFAFITERNTAWVRRRMLQLFTRGNAPQLVMTDDQ